jgi:hypothetical protein
MPSVGQLGYFPVSVVAGQLLLAAAEMETIIIARIIIFFITLELDYN